LSVLTVLSEQTLEISKEVKDSFVPDPSLAKVVKDSTIVILFSSDLLHPLSLRRSALLEGFLQEGHTIKLRWFDLNPTVEIW
jgi:hypothetical protein